MGVIAGIAGVFVALLGLLLPGGNGDVSSLAAMNLKTNLVIVGSALLVAGVVASSAVRIEKGINLRSAADVMDRAIDRHTREQQGSD